MVKIVSDGELANGSHDDQIAAIKTVQGSSALIELTTGVTLNVSEQFLKPVIPQKRDTFKVLQGEDRGRIGNLLSIDGHEGVVKIDGNDEILMMNLDALAKIAQ